MNVLEGGRGCRSEKAGGQVGQGSVWQPPGHTYRGPQNWHQLRAAGEREGPVGNHWKENPDRGIQLNPGVRQG